MANKFIRHGETFCGDGTTSAAAASNGGVGAWNNINAFEGSAPAYGVAPAAGDVVYIRSKDAAGADITRVSAAAVNLGSTAATAADPISWIIDGGTKWPGVSGVLTYRSGGTGHTHTFRALNYFEAEVQDALVYDQPSEWPVDGAKASIAGYIKRTKFLDLNTAANKPTLLFQGSKTGIFPTLDSCTVRAAVGRASYGIMDVTNPGRLINTSIEVTSGTNNVVFLAESSYSSPAIEVFGGRLFGAGVGSTTKLVSFTESTYGSSCKLFSVGFEVPLSVSPALNANTWRGSSVECVGMDGGAGAVLQRYWGYANSRSDNNPPILSATFPDSTSKGWSWRIGPERASFTNPAQITLTKLYTSPADAMTIELECLTAVTLALTKRSLWITVTYVDDTTGLTKSVSSFDPTAAPLDVSYAGWLPSTTWGYVTTNKRKLSVITPTTIKRDTLVTVLFNCAVGQATNDDVLFVDPDFVML